MIVFFGVLGVFFFIVNLGLRVLFFFGGVWGLTFLISYSLASTVCLFCYIRVRTLGSFDSRSREGQAFYGACPVFGGTKKRGACR